MAKARASDGTREDGEEGRARRDGTAATANARAARREDASERARDAMRRGNGANGREGRDAGRGVRVMLPLDCVARTTTRTTRETLAKALRSVADAGADGVMVDCWWGACEGERPRAYEWRGYLALCEMCRDAGLSVDVVLSFHACGDSVGDEGCEIGLPEWARGEPARENMYADRRGNVTEEYLSLWGDETRDARRGDRSPLECYRDFMAAFRAAFATFLTGSADAPPVISQVIIGLGPCGELRYPSYRAGDGWHFPGVGEFQAFDERARMSLAYEAAACGKPEWGRHPPVNGPSYNCDPEGNVLEPPIRRTSEDEPDAKRRHTMTASTSNSSLTSASFSCAPESASRSFFAADGTGDWNTPYGKFFLSWYSRELVAHGERVLEHAVREFDDVDASLGIKCAGVHWWHGHPSRAAECTAGYYNATPSPPADGNSDVDMVLGCEPRGYSQIIDLCARFGVELTFTCVEMRDVEHSPEHMCSPEGLLAQVLREAAEAGVTVNGENALARFDDDAFAQIVRTYERYAGVSPSPAKPLARLSSSMSAENVSSPGAESRNSLSSDDTMMTSSSSPDTACVLGSFTYLRMCDELFEPQNFDRFARFMRDMRRTQF